MRDDKGQEIGSWYVEFGNLNAVAQDDVAKVLLRPATVRFSGASVRAAPR